MLHAGSLESTKEFRRKGCILDAIAKSNSSFVSALSQVVVWRHFLLKRLAAVDVLGN